MIMKSIFLAPLLPIKMTMVSQKLLMVSSGYNPNAYLASFL